MGLRAPCPDSSLDAESLKGGDRSLENVLGRLSSLPPLPGLDPWRPPAEIKALGWTLGPLLLREALE